MPITQTETDRTEDALEYYITYQDKDFIRIEDEDGCSVSIRVTSSDFFIISILVSEDLRLQGRGRGLLAAAEQLAYTNKKSYVRIAYVDSEAMSSFIKKCGYRPVDEASISVFSVKQIQRKTGGGRLLAKVPADYEYVSLGELDIGGFEELMKFLGGMGLSSAINRISDMDFDISGVLFVRGAISAVVLCARMGDDIYIDTAVSAFENDKKIIAAAAVGMLDLAFASGALRLITDEPQGLSRTVIGIITGGYMGEESAKWVHAIKHTKEPEGGDEKISIQRDVQTELRNEWQRELRHFPMQRSMVEKNCM